METLGLPAIHCYSNGLGSVSATVCSRFPLWKLASGRRLNEQAVSSSSRLHSSRPFEYRAQLPTNDDDNDEHPTKNLQNPSTSKPFRSHDAAELRDAEQDMLQSRPPYRLITGLASVGFVETAYLAWAKIGGTPVTCPIGGNCKDVLDSSYATVFGIPLALVGVVAYGAVGLLGGIGLYRSYLDLEEKEIWVRWLLLASTTSMAAASTYFIYILIAKLEGASCAYCVSSVIISFSLFLSTYRGFTSKDMRTMAGLQLAITFSVALGLTVAFADANADWARSQDLDIPPVEPEVVTVSSSKEISLAKHLQSIGARMYGAFWCSHCYEQKQMFGREAMKFVDYVECYPEGYRKGVQIADACNAADIQGFPTWIIKGKTLSGEQKLEDLAKASDFIITD